MIGTCCLKEIAKRQPAYPREVQYSFTNDEQLQEATLNQYNRPFTSCRLPQFQNESSCEPIQMKMTDLHENGREGGTHFHMNGFARGLVLKRRQRVIRKWFINW